MTETKQSLDAFNWDAQAQEVDFFGENAPEGMVIEPEAEVKPEEKEEKKGDDRWSALRKIKLN